MIPNLAPQSRVPFESIASNTGSNAPGELEMICNTSEVAVCRSRASLSSRVRCCSASNSRTFSIDQRLIGKGRDQLNLLVGERLHDGARQHDHTDRHVLPQQRDAEDGAKAAAVACHAQRVFRVGQGVYDMNRAPLDRGAAAHRTRIRRDRMLPQVFDTVWLNVLAGGGVIAAT